MKKAKIIISILLASVLILLQVATVLAAPAASSSKTIAGTVKEVTLETDVNTVVTTVLVTIIDKKGVSQTVRIGEQTASDLGLLDYDDDGNPFIVDPLPEFIEIKSTDVIANEDAKNPVGSALATFFSDITGLDYDAIMDAHSEGYGFGVIAQALWLTRKLDGDASIFQQILQAKKDGDFSQFTFEDGTSPTNWGQFRKAILGGDKKGSLGFVMSQKNKETNGNGGTPNDGNANGKNNKDNKDKPNKDNGNGKGNPNKP